MSYRNPGEIYIANPNAFMEAFEKSVAPYKTEIERKAEERKKRAEKYDASNARLKQSLDYPEWVKRYGKQKADAIKGMVEEDYISNNRFASGTQSEQQDMLDELQSSIGMISQKTDAALQIDYDEILPGQFEDNPEFLDFITNKPAQDNQVSLDRVNGQMGFSYIKDGQKAFLSVDKIPDGATGYQGRSQVYEAFEAGIKDAVAQVDDHVRKAGEATSVKNKLTRSANNIFAQINDPSQRAYLFELAQAELKDQEEGKVDYSYLDIAGDEKLKKAADDVIISYIESRIEDDSAEIDGIKQNQREKLEAQRLAEEKAKQKVVKPTSAEIKAAERSEFKEMFDADPIQVYLSAKGSAVDIDEDTGEALISYNTKTKRYDIVSDGNTASLTKEELFASAYKDSKDVLDVMLQDFRERKSFISSMAQQPQENNDFLD
jgi:hypothetical protein